MIVAESGRNYRGPNGQGLTIIPGEEGIRLNGPKAAGESFETFHLWERQEARISKDG